MNLPEGYLLRVLQEQFGPYVGADPTQLLAVVGRNMIGRLKVAAPGAVLSEPPQAFELKEVLRGDNSEQAFDQLIRRHAASGVSGVVPKFLDDGQEQLAKTTVITRKHIIKGSSVALPYIALNEHLCMEVTRRVMPAAQTEVSDDGRALVVHRFDVDAHGEPWLGMEDFCALLGMRPAAKYDSTWERVAKAVRAHVPGPAQGETLSRLAQIILLTFALRNSDCHSKNIALLYSSRADVRLAPTYDMFTTVAYVDYRDRPPGLQLAGKKTWTPGTTLSRPLVATFGVAVQEQRRMVEAISDAAKSVAPEVREAMKRHRGFEDVGKRMLLAWQEGVSGLRELYGLDPWKAGAAFQLTAPARKKRNRRVIGHSELLATRRKK
jgi:serine/threonine-protein kinase HipA